MSDYDFKRTVTVHTLQEMCKATGWPKDRKSTAYALRLAKAEGPEVYEAVLQYALSQRAMWRDQLFRWQRHWQTRVSRRPQRGNHHDSWAIRERYVRCSNSPGR